jgi:uncharacterized protein
MPTSHSLLRRLLGMGLSRGRRRQCAPGGARAERTLPKRTDRAAGEGMAASAIYEGTIRHRRNAVREHEFRHRLALLYLDLHELDRVLDGRLLARRPGLVRFRRRDYPGDPGVALADCVRTEVERQAGSAPIGPVRILTQPRTLGHCFNPVSFYYCFTPPGAARRGRGGGNEHAVGRAARLCTDAHRRCPGASAGFVKALHVSPFMGMDQRYTIRVSAPGPTLSVHIESRDRGRRVFDATLSLPRPARPTRDGARDHALPGGNTARAHAHLRPRASAEAEGCAGSPSSRGAGVTATQNIAFHSGGRGARATQRVARRIVFGEGAPCATVQVNSRRLWPKLLQGSRRQRRGA